MSYTSKQIAVLIGMDRQVTINRLRTDPNAPQPLEVDEFDDSLVKQSGRQPKRYDEEETHYWIKHFVKKEVIIHEVPTQTLVNQFLRRPMPKLNKVNAC